MYIAILLQTQSYHNYDVLSQTSQEKYPSMLQK